MTLDELVDAIGTRRVCRHNGQCFLAIRNPAEAELWHGRGATIRLVDTAPLYSAEAHLTGCLDFVGEPDPDDPDVVIDIRPLILLDYFRKRDGFMLPARWYDA